MNRPVCVAIVLAFTSTSAFAETETCVASHYGYSGSRTASGERMNQAEPRPPLAYGVALAANAESW